MASRKKNRRHVGFNLAFLDVMSCGFGAAVLLFLIIKHGVTQSPNGNMEAARLQEDIAQQQEALAEIDGNISAMKAQTGEQEAQLTILDGEIAAASGQIEAVKQATAELSGKIEEAKKALAAIEATVQKQEKDAAIKIEGQASQQFLTGLSVEGQRIVIMVDHSASMLDEKIINIVRRRAIGGETASKAPKWTRTQRIAQWLVNRLPENGAVRFVSFSETAAAIPENGWIRASNTSAVLSALQKTIDTTPNGGTNLYEAFTILRDLSPTADTVYLVTDGLPTLGRRISRKTTVSGRERLTLFNEAVKSLRGTRAKMNIVLLPLEGDPDAAFAFWQLSRATGGRMLSPSEKWP